jgi:hypothetical protein
MIAPSAQMMLLYSGGSSEKSAPNHVVTTCLDLHHVGTIFAGTLQRVVLEQASGRPLARTVVRLDSVQKSGGNIGPSNQNETLAGWPWLLTSQSLPSVLQV